MNNPKNLLLIALFFLGFLLYAEWQQDYGPKPVSVENNSNINQYFKLNCFLKEHSRLNLNKSRCFS